jgi:hypothetical protein
MHMPTANASTTIANKEPTLVFIRHPPSASQAASLKDIPSLGNLVYPAQFLAKDSCTTRAIRRRITKGIALEHIRIDTRTPARMNEKKHATNRFA